MIECIKFTSCVQGTLQGFADIIVPKWGIEIKNISLHMKNGARWINLPCKESTSNGKKIYTPILKFIVHSHQEAFGEQVKSAIDRFCKQNSQLDLFEKKDSHGF